MQKKQKQRLKRHRRVRAKIFGTAQRPRLCVFRSNKHIYAQLIDDEKRKTIVVASDLEIGRGTLRKVASQQRSKKIKDKEEKPLAGKVSVAYEIGKLIAEKALKKKIEKVIFDRGGFAYHGRVKALAEGAKEGGLRF